MKNVVFLGNLWLEAVIHMISAPLMALFDLFGFHVPAITMWWWGGGHVQLHTWMLMWIGTFVPATSVSS